MTAIIFIIFQITHFYLVNSFSNFFFFNIKIYVFSCIFPHLPNGYFGKIYKKKCKNIYILSFGEGSPSSNLSL